MKSTLRCLFILVALFAGIHQVAAQTLVFPITTPTNILELVQSIGSSGSNYLVGIGENDTNVCLQLISSNGALAGSLLTVGASEGEPRVAFGTTNYLAFWGDDYISGAVDL